MTVVINGYAAVRTWITAITIGINHPTRGMMIKGTGITSLNCGIGAVKVGTVHERIWPF